MKEGFITRFGGGGETHLTGIGIALLALGVILILVLRRKYSVVPLLLVGLLLPGGEEFVIGIFHFPVLRILLAFAWLRVLFGRRSSDEPFRMSPIDKSFLYYALSAAVIYCLLWRQSEALVNRFGFLYNTLGVYFFCRWTLEDTRDVIRVIKVFALICLLFAVAMVIEQHTGRNFFSALGGVAAITEIREGKLRSQGSFESSISAGIFAATLLPVFVGLLWQKGKAKLFAFVGIVSATLMTLTSSSATPVSAYGAGILALCFWPIRNQMKWVRRGIVAMVVGLHLVMKAPVWGLIGRVSIVGGNSGYHREMLVDGFIRHFFDWCLIGVRSTYNWGHFTFDQANQYVYVGANGGLLTFVFFIAILVYCFKGLGKARRALEGDRQARWLMWALGSCLFAHMVAFIGLSYFDQTLTQLYVLLAMIATATAPFWKGTADLQPAREARSTPAKAQRPEVAGLSARSLSGQRWQPSNKARGQEKY